MGGVRAFLKHFPRPAAASPGATRALLQPFVNNVGWPQPLVPDGVSVQAGTVRGVKGEWLLPRGQKLSAGVERLLVWAHGGGFVYCSPASHRRFLGLVAASADVPVFCVDYRKPPGFPYPAPAEDVANAFQGLREQGLAQRLFLGGDSAGGNLAIAATKALVRPEAELAPPEGVLLLSPWVDLSDISGDSWQSEEDYIPADLAQVAARYYAGGLPLEDGRLSPARSHDWARFPPVLLEYAEAERFRSQIERLQAAMGRGGVDVRAWAEEGQVHGYPLWDFVWGGGPGPFEAFFGRVAAFLRR